MNAIRTPSRRSTCALCLRPAPTCLCRWVTPVSSAVELLVLQHPLEVANAKNSARLLHLCVPGSRMLVGERFDPEQLAAALRTAGRTPVLLYPDTPGYDALGVAPAPPLPRGLLDHPERLRLVILDATWRKSRKMLFQNPLLHQLPRMALQPDAPSQYRIRKAHAADQLSTLEAACLALAQTERSDTKFLPVLAAFDAFVEMLAQHQPGGLLAAQTPKAP